MLKLRPSHIVLVGLVIIIGVMLLTQQSPTLFNAANTNSQTTNSTAPVLTYESADGYEAAIISAVDRVSPAIVSITISKNVPIIENCPYNPFGDLPPEFQQFFGGDSGFSRPCQKGTKLQDIGGGSGFIVSKDGLIVTNKHVVSDQDASYTVFTNDGKNYKARVLARDPVQDIAIIKIEGANLPTMELADSDAIRLGQTAIAIGNSLGEFRNTVSVGIVSGLARTVTASTEQGMSSETLEGVIQTDAAINPGNSGGPLINLKGQVIGINTAVVSGANNIGFALPINNAKRDISSVKATGKITAPYLGVRYVMLSQEIASRDGISVHEGALVRGGEDGPAIAKDSPAAKAGVLAEDVITKVNGITLDKDHSLVATIQKFSAGDTITLTIVRGGKTLTISVTLAERT
jgi:serine protease Do